MPFDSEGCVIFILSVHKKSEIYRYVSAYFIVSAIKSRVYVLLGKNKLFWIRARYRREFILPAR